MYEKRILITGGAGFIGSHLVIHMVKKYPQYYIINLDMLDYCASLENLKEIQDAKNYKFIWGDVCDGEFVKKIFEEEQINTVMHLAAKSHVDLSFWYSLEFTQTNVFGTHVLLSAAQDAKVDRFLMMSTDEVYGGSHKQNVKETTKMDPTNPYSASKAAAECIVRSFWWAFKFPVVTVRPNNVYGPHQYPEKVIPKFISLLDRGKKCCIYGTGEEVRNFVFVTDVVKALDLVLHEGELGDIYNVGTDFQLSVNDLATRLIKKMKGVETEAEVKDSIENVQDRPYNDLGYYLDSSKIHQLGWKPQVAWDEGIIQTISWYRENFSNWKNAEAALATFPLQGQSSAEPNNNRNNNNNTESNSLSPIKGSIRRCQEHYDTLANGAAITQCNNGIE